MQTTALMVSTLLPQMNLATHVSRRFREGGCRVTLVCVPPGKGGLSSCLLSLSTDGQASEACTPQTQTGTNTRTRLGEAEPRTCYKKLFVVYLCAGNSSCGSEMSVARRMKHQGT